MFWRCNVVGYSRPCNQNTIKLHFPPLPVMPIGIVYGMVFQFLMINHLERHEKVIVGNVKIPAQSFYI